MMSRRTINNNGNDNNVRLMLADIAGDQTVAVTAVVEPSTG